MWTWIDAHLSAVIVAVSCAVAGTVVLLAAIFGGDPTDI